MEVRFGFQTFWTYYFEGLATGAFWLRWCHPTASEYWIVKWRKYKHGQSAMGMDDLSGLSWYFLSRLEGTVFTTYVNKPLICNACVYDTSSPLGLTRNINVDSCVSFCVYLLNCYKYCAVLIHMISYIFFSWDSSQIVRGFTFFSPGPSKEPKTGNTYFPKYHPNHLCAWRI